MAQTATTRRDLLRIGTSAAAYAAGAAIVTGGIALAGEAKGATPAVSPALTALIAEVDRLVAASDDLHERVYMPARVRWLAAKEEAQRSLPHTSVQLGNSVSGQPVVWTTADRSQVAMAKTMARRKADPGPFPAGHISAARTLTAAHLRRERAIAAATNSRQLTAIMEQCDAFGEAIAEAEERVADFAASTLADLHAKVAFMHRRDLGNGMDRVATVLADLNRLVAGGEA